MGRKAKFTNRDREKYKTTIIGLLEENPIIHLACKKMGISRQTLYRWKQEDKDFAKDVEKSITIGYGIINDLAESRLVQCIKESQPWAIKFLLSNRHEGYGKKSIPVTEEVPEAVRIILPDNGRMTEFNRRKALNNPKPKEETFYKSKAGKSYLKQKKA